MTERIDDPQVIVHEGTVLGYRVVYEQIPTSWGVYAPDLPGMGVVGDSREEVERLIAEAIPRGRRSGSGPRAACCTSARSRRSPRSSSRRSC
jgi:hypothetical protein